MNYCPKCKIKIAGNKITCPFCQSELEGEKTEEVFPIINKKSKKRFYFVLKLLILISAVAVISSGTVNLILSNTGHWALYVLSGLACIWLVSTILLLQIKNILKTIFSQTIVIAVISILWDFAMGRHGWSLDFVLPCLLTAALIGTGILALALRMKVEDYSIYLCNYGLLSFIPVVLLALKKVMPLPSFISVGVNVTVLFVFFIFQGGKIADDIKRRIHI